MFLIGDVHGRDDLLVELLDRYPHHAKHLVFLGDLVDRGEESAQVLTRVKALTDRTTNIICLRGNHEEMLLEFLRTPQETGPRWLASGGLQTLASFGVGGLSAHSKGPALEAAAEALAVAMGPDLQTWIETRPTFWQSGSLVAVHAAADPGLPMTAQDDETRLWGHPGFFAAPRRDGLWVAHGHTVTDAPTCAHSRISLDTGAWYTGRLTGALVEPDGNVEFVSSGA